MIKVGLIGAGFMGGMHANCYEALMENMSVKVVAVADINKERAEKLASKFGAKTYTSGFELIEMADVNVVDICLPTYLHAQNAIMAMEKGLDVFIEKPVCLNLEEAARLEETQYATGRKVMVGHCIRFWTEYVYLKELVDSGKYGKVNSAVFKRISPRPGWAWEDWINDEKRSGSAALDLHVHDVDYVRYILGDPDTIKSSVVKSGGNSEHIFSIYQYGDVTVQLEGGWDYPSSFPFEMEYRVKFDLATVVFSSAENPSLKVYKVYGEVEEPKFEDQYEAKSGDTGGNISSLGGYYNELKYFIECLEQDKSIEVASLTESVKSLRLILKEIELGQN